MECIAVDWSGALTGAAARIWIASAIDGKLTSLMAPGSREAVRDVLTARRADQAPVLVGLDFAFSVPAWYAATRGWREVAQVWRAARDEGEGWLRDCAPPFWGRPGTRRPYEAPMGLRITERDAAPSQQPKSFFQVGGAGSVGTGSIRGMPMLLALREVGWAVWPFDAAGSHTLVEIWPRLFTGPVVKRHAETRAAWLATHHSLLEPRFRRIMTDSEDAFDAGLSAIGMTALDRDVVLRRPTDAITLIEGTICAPGPRGAD